MFQINVWLHIIRSPDAIEMWLVSVTLLALQRKIFCAMYKPPSITKMQETFFYPAAMQQNLEVHQG